MRVTVDTTEARSFELAEPGPYEMTIATIGDPRATEKTTVVDVEFSFDDPKMDQTCGKVRRIYPIAGKGAGFFREFWKGATGQDIPIGTKLDIDLDDAVGRHVLVDVGHTKPGDDNRVYNEASKVVSLS